MQTNSDANETIVLWLLPYWNFDYNPESAQLVIETIGEQSDETCGLLFALAGMKASGEWNVN